MKEIWKDLIKDGFDNIYQISSFGGIRVKSSGKLRKIYVNKRNGYCYINLHNKGYSKSFRVHILVAEHFLGDKPLHNSVVGHKDNNKQNNNVSNLYWTVTKENTRKAVKDNLIKYKKGIENDYSEKIKVLEVSTNEIVGVYGSIRECARCVENVSSSFIQKVCRKQDYKTRSKKYKYLICTDQEFEANKDKQVVHLIENPLVDKRPVKFFVTNNITGETKIYDNQTQLAKEINIQQAIISKLVRENGVYGDYSFRRIEKIEVQDSTMYSNFIESLDGISIRNIYTNEVIDFKTQVEMKQFLDIQGNDIMQYKNKNYLLNGKWEVL